MSSYLDHAATTPVRPEATAAMMPWLTGSFGNPSGSHSVARAARRTVDEARDSVAADLGVEPGGVVFTAGGSEADNLAILGVVARRPGPVVTTAGEHHAVLHAARAAGVEVREVPLTPEGTVDLDGLAAALDRTVSIVSVMAVNNEVGAINPLEDIVTLVRRKAGTAVVHTDAVAAVAWLDVAEAAARVDLLSISAHKFGGPQGVGALAVHGDVALAPIVHGGGQERDRRSGTHNVAGIAGLAAALAAITAARGEDVARVATLRNRLVDAIVAAVPGATETTPRCSKVAGNAHVRFPGVEAESLLVLLDDAGVCASAGSSCASGAMEPSHVLVAMGLSEPDALASVRFSLGWTTTAAEVDEAVAAVVRSVRRLVPA
ncbi:MAG: cysteine desulfurase [Actinomycetota bacterium]|nr:cysteine desulfurase [Actinomycetota bacterium]